MKHSCKQYSCTELTIYKVCKMIWPPINEKRGPTRDKVYLKWTVVFCSTEYRKCVTQFTDMSLLNQVVDKLAERKRQSWKLRLHLSVTKFVLVPTSEKSSLAKDWWACDIYGTSVRVRESKLWWGWPSGQMSRCCLRAESIRLMAFL